MRVTKSRVLVVDDEPAICRQLASMIKRIGRTASTVLTVEEALATIRHRSCDVVLTDLLFKHEPRGFVVIEAARAEGLGVIAMTGSAEPDLPNQCNRVGVACLRKPFCDADLDVTLARQELPPELLARALALALDELERTHDLTKTEAKLAAIIARGIGPGAFAHELDAKEKLMNTTRASLFKKCDVLTANQLEVRLLKRAIAFIVEGRVPDAKN